jgi:hypothetical protein
MFIAFILYKWIHNRSDTILYLYTIPSSAEFFRPSVWSALGALGRSTVECHTHQEILHETR